MSPTIQPGYQAACPGASWSTIGNTNGDFDWGELLRAAPNTPLASVVGIWLYLEEPFDGWLLVGADGKVRVSIDGRWGYKRDQPTPRGHGFVPIALSLGVGFHPLWLGLERASNRSTFSVLLRDRKSNQAPLGAQLYLPGDISERRLLELSLETTLRIRRQALAPTLDVDLAFPASLPANELPVTIELQGAERHRWSPGSFAAATRNTEPFRVHLGPLDALTSEQTSTLVVDLGRIRVSRKLQLTLSAVSSLERGYAAQSNPLVIHASTSSQDDLGATLEAATNEVATRMLQPDPHTLKEAVDRLNALCEQLELGKNPLLSLGFVDAYVRSPYDGRPTSVLTYVPADFAAAPDKRRALVVVLHGYNGNSRRILDAFLDSQNPKYKSLVDGFVLAPDAYGNTFYRGAGEHAVLDAIDWATRTYPVDTARISITGVSMGGTGTTEIAFRHSERFSAAAPLCGYHSYFVRRDTANKPLRPWEKRLMHRFSPASMAESGNDIPLYVAHGLKDRPLENSKSLTLRYRALGYNLTEDWPDLGHAVWKKTYGQAGLYPWLTQWRKDSDPEHVVMASASVAQGQKFWLALTQLEGAEKPGRLDARIVSPHEVEVSSSGVSSFLVGTSRHLDESALLRVTIDGTSISIEPKTPRHFGKVASQWRLLAAPAAVHRAPAEGPWSELWNQPLAVVYGTLDPSTTSLNREIARRLVEPRAGVTVSIPITADRDFTPAASPLTRVIYVGTPRDHQQLATIANKLPILLVDGAVELGGHRFTEPDVGVAFVYPDPDRRERLLGVVSGNGPAGLWRVLGLPALVPDFVVFDHGMDVAAGETVLGEGYVRAAGFFLSDWTLPENPLDPLAPLAR